MSTRREQYANAPLAVVTAEVQLGYEPAIKQESVRDHFASLVREDFPLLSEEQSVSLTFESNDLDNVQKTVQAQVRATSVDGNATVTLNPGAVALTISGTSYGRYSDSFAPKLDQVLNALAKVAPSALVHRIGLRFIDEIRFQDSGDGDARMWAKWVRPELLSGLGAFSEIKATELRSAIVFAPEVDRLVRFGYGTLEAVSVIDQDLPFYPRDRGTSKMFVLDVDSSWMPKGQSVLNPGRLSEIAYELHRPASDLFDWAVTDAAKEKFREQGEM